MSFLLIRCLALGVTCATCYAREAGVMVVKFENHAPVTQVETNDLHTSPMWKIWEKQTPDIQPETPKRWRTLYDNFSAALVTRAKQEGLHSASLQVLLRKLTTAKENKDLALLPVAAHETREDGEAVWFIVLKWEGEAAVSQGDALAHMRVFTFKQKTLKQTNFVTCG